MAYQGVNYMRAGDQAMVVGGKIVVASGGSIVPASETQAAHIADVATNASFTTTAAAAVNSIIAALEGVGILATS